jgi:kynurenine formamidase
MTADQSTRPRYKDLPDGNAKGVYGDDDFFGCLNLLTPERTAAAARLISSGHVVNLNASLIEWNNPNFFSALAPSRAAPPVHEVVKPAPFARDDILNSFNLQCSTQWDGFLHVGDSEAESWYNGRTDESQGMDLWAKRGIAGRGVLLDVAAWAQQSGNPIDWRSRYAITVEDLDRTAASHGVALAEGTILFVRTGWETGYRNASRGQKDSLPWEEPQTPGLAADPSLPEWLWDSGVAAVASDNPALEQWPMSMADYVLHVPLLARLGIPIGEFFLLDELAETCAREGRYEFFVTSAPLNVPGGIGSPANALAIF